MCRAGAYQSHVVVVVPAVPDVTGRVVPTAAEELAVREEEVAVDELAVEVKIWLEVSSVQAMAKAAKVMVKSNMVTTGEERNTNECRIWRTSRCWATLYKEGKSGIDRSILQVRTGDYEGGEKSIHCCVSG